MLRRNNIVVFLLVTTTLTGIFFSIETYQNNVELRKQITLRDSTISKFIVNDSLYKNATKRYADTVTKYISSDSAFYLDNKQITASQVIGIANFYKKKYEECYRVVEKVRDTDSELRKLDSTVRKKRDSLNLKLGEVARATIDSLFIAQSMLKLVKQRYGISYKVKRTEDGSAIFTRLPSKADSAIILFSHFKKNLSFDSIARVWYVDTPQSFEEKLPRSKKKNRK
jgi:hypothetical protein